MHTELPPARRSALNGDGVVKVARIHRVDGQQEAIANIASQRILKSRFNIELQRLGFRERCGRVATDQVIARHNSLNARVRGVLAPDSALDRHHTRLHACGVAHNARGNKIAIGNV